ncbi:CueP family metal-binding protein [Virgibacillus kimchii]
MKLKFTVTFLLIFVFLAGCTGGNTADKDGSIVEDKTDIKELVNEYSLGNILEAEEASITSTELIVTSEEDGNETIYDLPEEEFFVSIAPFISETHPCTNHSLTGCQGEMVNQNFEIYIEDMDGNVIVDDTVNAEANGFIDLWLPRDESFHVEITHDEKLSEAEISTFEDDKTCITTMQLS